MNNTLIIWVILSLTAGYYFGFQHGDYRARRDAIALRPATIIADYPFANICSDMLEAAWSVQDTAPSGLPHKP